MFKNKYVILACVTTLVVLADQLSKIWIRINIPLRHRPTDVIPGLFRLVHVENEGAAWGLLASSEHRIPFFIVATVVAFVVIGIYFYKIPKGQNLVAVAMSSILGGAIGNFLDRMIYHSVTDFLDFYISWQPVSSWLIRHFRSNRWPSFNLADVAIVFGLLLIVYDMLVLEGRRAKQAAAISSGKDEKTQTSAEGGSR